MSLNGWGKKASNITLILGLIIMVGTYVISIIPYALASDLKALDDRHRADVVADNHRFSTTMKNQLEKDIKRIEDDLALYQLDRAERALTPRERLNETQLVNRKAERLRELDGLSPR